MTKRQIRNRLGAILALVVALAGPAAARPLSIVAFGDSLSVGFNLPADAAFPSQLEAALKAKGYDVAVANAGVSGDTASAGLERVDWSVPEGTDLVILELGANDMLRGIDPAVTRSALDAILARLQARHIGVLFAGMLAAPNLGPDYGRAFAAIYQDLARAHDVPCYPFFLDGIVGRPDLHLPDGMHPNRAGVRVIVDHILPAVEAALDTIRKAKP